MQRLTLERARGSWVGVQVVGRDTLTAMTENRSQVPTAGRHLARFGRPAAGTSGCLGIRGDRDRPKQMTHGQAGVVGGGWSYDVGSKTMDKRRPNEKDRDLETERRLSEEDEWLSASDQTLSERNRAQSDRDQDAADYDQVAAESGARGRRWLSPTRPGRRCSRRERARSGSKPNSLRDEIAHQREETAHERDRLADQRDSDESGGGSTSPAGLRGQRRLRQIRASRVARPASGRASGRPRTLERDGSEEVGWITKEWFADAVAMARRPARRAAARAR